MRTHGITPFPTSIERMTFCILLLASSPSAEECCTVPSRLLPPGNLSIPGFVACNASARSIRTPFVRLRYVGGKSENNPKWISFPAIVSPLNVTRKVLSRSRPEALGLSLKVNFCQDDVIPLILATAKVAPDEETRHTSIVPLNWSDLA